MALPALLLHPMALPLGIAAAIVVSLSKDKPLVAPNDGTAFSAADKAEMLRADTGNVQTFKLDIQSLIVRRLGNHGVTSETAEGMQSGRALFRVVDSGGDISAAQAALAAQAAGLVVMGSLSLIGLAANTAAPKYLLFCGPADREAAGSNGQFAVLLDSRLPAGNAATPGVETAMAVNVAEAVKAILADPSPNTAELRQAATMIEAGGFAVAAKTIRSRADAVDLERNILAAVPSAAPSAVAGNVVAPAVVHAEPAAAIAAPVTEPIAESVLVVAPESVVVEVVGEVMADAARHLNGHSKKPAFTGEVITVHAEPSA